MSKTVIPAKAGIHPGVHVLDSGFRRNDERHWIPIFAGMTARAGMTVLMALIISGASLTFGETPITQTHITSPYYLDKANERYVLQNNVRADRTAFVITADGVTLDLGGNTVTYDDALPITVPNGDFEKGTENWDTSAAPDAKVVLGPYSHLPTYSTDHALSFPVPSRDQYVRTIGVVTLDPNQTYVLTAVIQDMVSGPGPLATNANGVHIYAQFEDRPDVLADGVSITWRGSQYMEKIFTTGSSPETHRIIAGVKGTTTVRDSGFVYIDNIKVQKWRSYGVLIGCTEWQQTNPNYVYYPDIDTGRCISWGTTNTTVKNGTINQGQEGGDRCNAVFVGAGGTGNEISNLNITVYGENAVNISNGSDGGGGLGKVHDNNLYNNVKQITSRDQFDGAVISWADEVYNNNIYSGVQNGIVQGSKNHGDVYGNHITLTSRYTNDFAIQLWNKSNSNIHDNVIDCGSGDNSCRGIAVAGGSSGIKVYKNTITVQELPRNQEYDGCEMAGAYGIQSETASNAEYYGNNVTANAASCQAYAFRANPGNDGTTMGSNIDAHDNVFSAVSNNSNLAAPVKVAEADSTSLLNITNNTLITNFTWLFFDSTVQDLTFPSNIYETSGNLPSPFHPLWNYNWDGNSPSKNIRFVDNKYPDAATANLFSNTSGIFRGPAWDTSSTTTYHYSWTLNLTVQGANHAPVADATVIIVDKDGNQAYAGTTTSGGLSSTVLDEFFVSGINKTTYNDYTLTIIAPGYANFVQMLTMDKPTNLVVDLVTGISTPLHFINIIAVNGSVSKNPNQAIYTPGTQVTLTALPNTGYFFNGWSGDLTGKTNPATITMDGNKTITSNFMATAPNPSPSPTPGPMPPDAKLITFVTNVISPKYGDKIEMRINHKGGELKLEIFNQKGDLVVTLAEGSREAGLYTFTWLGQKDDGKKVASGTYHLKVQSGDIISTGKLAVMK